MSWISSASAGSGCRDNAESSARDKNHQGMMLRVVPYLESDRLDAFRFWRGEGRGDQARCRQVKYQSLLKMIICTRFPSSDATVQSDAGVADKAQADRVTLRSVAYPP